jgi:2-polyprenyl-3-methyl-5-hydroxy-6-metoxy-1,4-benzoquinol methylase
MAMIQETAFDMGRVDAISELAFGYLNGMVVSGMIYLGDELGLYRSMRGAGALTGKELAGRAGLHERWVLEWLRGQAAAGLLDYRGDGRFELSAEAALVLADEDNPASFIGSFSDLPGQYDALTQVLESFRTGVGFTYDSGGEAVARSVERMLGPWNKTALITDALPAVEGAIERLRAGAKMADVGCGAAVADIALAKAFPNSEFHGYENSKFALERARANMAAAGVSNVFVHDIDEEPLPEDGSVDLVTCLDVLHDMARPDLAAAAIRKAIKPDGIWFIVDIESSEDFADNLSNPAAAMMYGFSVMTCLPSAASTPDGLALGTCGLPEPRMRELVTAAGFTRFQRVPGLEHPFNAYYEARV